MNQRKEMGHAERALEGRTAWVKKWHASWEEACHCAVREEKLGTGRSMSRKVWAAVIIAARDSTPPASSDEICNEQIAAAWKSAWAAAIVAAKAILEDRPDSAAFPPKVRPWDAASRAARAQAGRDAGCSAWNETYRAEIKKSGKT